MKKNISISKISYLYEGWTDGSDEGIITDILQKPIYSYIESSYNSIVMMNVHNGNENNSLEYNYLVFIDENGVGHPLYSVTEASTTSENSGPICVYPKIEINNLSGNYHTAENALNTVNEINSNVAALSSAVSNIVQVLNDRGVQTILGLNAGNTDAAAHVNYATEYAEHVSDRYNISTNTGRAVAEIIEITHEGTHAQNTEPRDETPDEGEPNDTLVEGTPEQQDTGGQDSGQSSSGSQTANHGGYSNEISGGINSGSLDSNDDKTNSEAAQATTP